MYGNMSNIVIFSMNHTSYNVYIERETRDKLYDFFYFLNHISQHDCAFLRILVISFRPSKIKHT